MQRGPRRIQLEALGFSFAGTAILTFSYGFLEGLGYPRLSMFTVWPMLAVLWIVGFVAVAGSAHAAGQRA